MASVKKVTVHGNVRWQVRWRDPDGKPGKKNFETAREANAHRTKVEAELNAGTYVDQRAGKETFRDFAERWRASQPHKPNTRRRVLSILTNWMYPAFGDRPIGAIRYSEVQGLVGAMATKLKPGSVGTNVRLLRTIFRAAVKDRLIKFTPAEDLVLPPAGKKKMVPLTVAQVEALADAMPARYRALVATGAGLGLRPGELFGLRVCDVSFLRKVVHVEQQVQPGLGVTGLKTDSSHREIPLPDVVASELAAHLAAYPAKADELVFRNERNGPVDSRNFWYIWIRVRKAAGVPKARIHDLRHFYASTLIAAGRSPKEVADRLGHEKASMTLDIYSHLWPTDTDATRSAIDDAFKRDGGREERTG